MHQVYIYYQINLKFVICFNLFLCFFRLLQKMLKWLASVTECLDHVASRPAGINWQISEKLETFLETNMTVPLKWDLTGEGHS